MKDTRTPFIGEALDMYRCARGEQDRHLLVALNISASQLETLKTQPFPIPRRAEFGELWITPNTFYAAINAIAETAGIVGIYRDQFESMLLWYCYRVMDNYQATIQYWLEKLEASYKPHTSFNNQMADIAIGMIQEMRDTLRR